MTPWATASQLSLAPSHVPSCATLWTVALQAPLSMWILQAGILECVAACSPRGLKLIFFESLVPSNYLILCRPLFLLPCLQSFPASESSNELALCIRWTKYGSFSFRISPSNEYSALISFRIDWFDLLAVQRTLKSLLHTTVLKPPFFGSQSFLWPDSHNCT